jgi:hypothetical protein
MAVNAAVRRFLTKPKSSDDELEASRATLQPRVRWRISLLILCAGVAFGAAVELFALWLFIHWITR